MLRKFRNLDKIEILQDAVNCLTTENERLKKKNENLESKLELTKNYWDKWQKDFKAEHIRVERLLATKEREIEELNDKYISETDLAKVKIYDLRKEVGELKQKNKELEKKNDDSIAECWFAGCQISDLTEEIESLEEDAELFKSKICQLEEQLEVFKTEATEWEEIAKARGDEINDLIERVAFLEDEEDGNVHAYQGIIAKQKEEIKNLKRGMKKKK